MRKELAIETSPRTGIVRMADAYMRRDTDSLEFGNRHYHRRVDLSRGYPATVSLAHADGPEYGGPKISCDCGFIGINRPGYNATAYRIIEVTVVPCADAVYDSPHLRIGIHFTDTVQEVEFLREIFVYPDLPAHSVRNSIRSRVLPNLYWNYRTELSGSGNTARYPDRHLESTGDSLRLADGFHPAKAVEFSARTDYTDQLVIEHRADGQSRMNGNLLYVQNESSAGFCILQEAMPSAEKRDFEPHDFRWQDGEVLSCTWGISPAEFKLNTWMAGCRHSLIVFRSRTEAARNLQEYLKRRFPIRPHERFITVNPWGCGRFQKLFSETFLEDEIEAAAKCAADIYQIDDSWQKGESLMSLMHNHHIKPDFWDISPERLGQDSFSNLCICARRHNIDLALWTAPSANTAFSDWRALAGKLLEYHRRYGFRMIKVDGVQLRSYEAESNLEQLLKTLREASGGAIYFNLDVTNGQRGGYFRFLEYGNIFLENRYVNLKNTIGYHPEKTLRSLWRLSRYVRTESLQIEIPAPDDVLPEFYESLRLANPCCYPLEYWAAIPMFASPLLWFAPSTVSPETRETVRRMMSLHRSIRDGVFGGHVFPVGEEPDGGAITGFYADRGWLLAFREAGCGRDTIQLELPASIPRIHPELLSGTGSLEQNSDGISLTLPERCACALFKLNP
jgi:hypothetical protein